MGGHPCPATLKFHETSLLWFSDRESEIRDVADFVWLCEIRVLFTKQKRHMFYRQTPIAFIIKIVSSSQIAEIFDY